MITWHIVYKECRQLWLLLHCGSVTVANHYLYNVMYMYHVYWTVLMPSSPSPPPPSMTHSPLLSCINLWNTGVKAAATEPSLIWYTSPLVLSSSVLLQWRKHKFPLCSVTRINILNVKRSEQLSSTFCSTSTKVAKPTTSHQSQYITPPPPTHTHWNKVATTQTLATNAHRTQQAGGVSRK